MSRDGRACQYLGAEILIERSIHIAAECAENTFGAKLAHVSVSARTAAAGSAAA
jgi:hypothetical protein